MFEEREELSVSALLDRPEPVILSTPGTVTLVAVADDLWRVVDRGGRVFGHLQRRRMGEGARWVARRFHVPSRAFREVGSFWSAAEAVDCLRLSR